MSLAFISAIIVSPFHPLRNGTRRAAPHATQQSPGAL
jgi:hypothetical protein